MKTKIITINGKPVLCRVLKKGEIILFSDVCEHGTPPNKGGALGEKQGVKWRQFYRPISKPKPRPPVSFKLKAKAGKVKERSITVWLGANGTIIGGMSHHEIKRLTGMLFPSFPLNVKITLRKPRSK